MEIKKLFIQHARLLLLTFLPMLAASMAWADQVTFEPGQVSGSQSGSTQGSDQMSSGIITVKTSKGQFGRTTDYRVYSGGTLTIEADGGVINKVTINTTSGYSTANFTGNDFVSLGSTGYWTGNATTVTLSASAQIRMSSIVVEYTANSSAVSTPVISGTTPFDYETTVTISADEDANIYYTLDGTTPTDHSIFYDEPFVITETTTVKAVAYADGEHSSMAEKTFVANPKFTVECNYPSGKYYEPFEVTFTPKNGTEPYSINYTVSTDNGTTTGTETGTFTLNINETSTVTINATDDSGHTCQETFEYIVTTFVPASTFKLVTSKSELAPGRQVLIAAAKDSRLYFMGKTGNNNRTGIEFGGYDHTVPLTVNANDEYCTTIIGKENNNYTFYDINEKGYLQALSSTKNQLGTGTLNDNARAEVSIDSNNLTSITFQGTNTRNKLQFNSQNNIFSCYSSDQTKVYLYVEMMDSYALTTDLDHDVVFISNFYINDEPSDINYAKEGDKVGFYLYMYNNNYIIDNVIATTPSGNIIDVTCDEYGQYHFTMPAEDVVISAFTHYAIHTLSINPVENATVKVNDAEVTQVELKEGSSVTVAVELEDDYSVHEFTVTDTQGNTAEVNNSTFENRTNFFFNMPADDATVNIVTGKSLHNINITENDQCTITAEPATAQTGQLVTITVTPNNPDIDEAKNIIVNGIEPSVITENQNGVFTFTMPANDVTVSATIGAYMHDLVLAYSGCTINGLETPEQCFRARGELVTFSITPDEHYAFYGNMTLSNRAHTVTYPITDNGDGTYSFTMPDEETWLNVTCVKTEYSVTPQIEHGTVECAPYGTMNETFTFTVLPENGYVIEQVKLLQESGHDLDIELTNLGNNQYSFVMPARNVRIYVNMVAAAYRVEIADIEHGNIIPNKTNANRYDTVVLQLIAEPGYKFDAITITYDGHTSNLAHNPSSNVTEFVMPNFDVVIGAVLSPIVYTISYDLDGGKAPQERQEGYDIAATFNYTEGWINTATCWAYYGSDEKIATNMVEDDNGIWHCTINGQPTNIYFRTDVSYFDEEIDIQNKSYECAADASGMNNGSASVIMVADNNNSDTYQASYTTEWHDAVAGNPTTYTVESDDITLTLPTREGYFFTGWTGTGLEQATATVTIEHGSTGNRQYTATWLAQTATALRFAHGDNTDTIYTLDGKKINPTKLYGSELPKGIYIINGKKVVK